MYIVWIIYHFISIHLLVIDLWGYPYMKATDEIHKHSSPTCIYDSRAFCNKIRCYEVYGVKRMICKTLTCYL